MKRDVEIAVANKLRTLMASENTNWVRPWVTKGAQRNAKSGRAYRGVNAFLTGIVASAENFNSPYWNTYRGWRTLAHQVAKGARSTEIIFWKKVEITDEESGETRTIPFARFYRVFNAAQLTEPFEHLEETQPEPAGVDPLDAAEALIDASGAVIHYGGERACYRPALDTISLPERNAFTSTDGFYSTAFHELGHWTGHRTRLDRTLSGWFGSPDYAFEELIAETASALICVHTGVTPEPRADHARYLNSWIRGLTDKPEAVMRAFSATQKAADLLMATVEPDSKIAARLKIAA